MSDHETLIKLLQSGNFTIAFHDFGLATIYAGKHNTYEDIPEDAQVHTCMEHWDGYINEEVLLLVTALGGKVVTA